MADINKIQENVRKELALLRKTEKEKQIHQWIIESLSETILRAELNLYRWKKQIEIFRKHHSYVQLAGFSYVETAVLLKEKVILELNHLLDTSGVSIPYLFKHIKRKKDITILEPGKITEIKVQISKDEKKITEITKSNDGLIKYRNENIAHSGIQKLGKKYEDYEEKFTPETGENLIKEFKLILAYYINAFNITIEYSLEQRLKSQTELGFETSIEDVVNVVEQAFNELSFSSEKIQKIASDFNIYNKVKADFKGLDR